MASTISKVHETCKCGASFEFSGDATEVLLALARFQAAHMVCRTTATENDDDPIGTETRDWRGRVK